MKNKFFTKGKKSKRFLVALFLNIKIKITQ